MNIEEKRKGGRRQSAFFSSISGVGCAETALLMGSCSGDLAATTAVWYGGEDDAVEIRGDEEIILYVVVI